MHENNKIRNPHEAADLPTKRAEIVISFAMPETEASQNFLDALIGSLRQDLKQDPVFVGKFVRVEGKWL